MITLKWQNTASFKDQLCVKKEKSPLHSHLFKFTLARSLHPHYWVGGRGGGRSQVDHSVTVGEQNNQ